MNERTQSAPLETVFRAAPEASAFLAAPVPARRPWSAAWRSLLACNSFYLVSAALLLFGTNRVSVNPDFLRTELAQLSFNFASLQYYELLLVSTAILLARRAVWYDSALLLFLENLLVFVPFMLVSQAALLERGMIWVFCGLAVVLVVVRAGAARRLVVGFTPAPRLLGLGAGLLAVNAAWPVIYRSLHELKVGTRPTSGAAFELNEASWLWLLPLLCALTSLLPHPRDDGRLPVQSRWFPVTFFWLWLLGTAVHLYSLGYVYDFTLRREMLAPVLCVFAWTFRLRLTDLIRIPPIPLRTAALVLPLAAALVAACAADNQVFFALTALNAMGYAGVALLERDNRAARHLLLVTLAALAATMPRSWIGPSSAEFDAGATWLLLLPAAYLVLLAVVSRSPKLAVAGAFAAALLAGLALKAHAAALHWAVQAGLVFYLLHSLRWRDYEHEGAEVVRVLTAIAWVVHAFVWAHGETPWWQPITVGAGVAVIGWGHWWIWRKPPQLVVPLAALLVALASPLHTGTALLQATPVGLMAVAGSFLLFGLGTWLALTKVRWPAWHS